MRWTTTELAAAAGGTATEEASGGGATIDSRTALPGQLFVAVCGERDGHEFVGAAAAAGCAAALVCRPDERLPCVVVDDTLVALQRAGGHARDAVSVPVVGITGSVGKTTTKDLLAAVLRQGHVVGASARSFNNELGVPLTLLNSPDDAGAVVVEMGARGIGHIADLCRIARPTIGVVTMVAAAHTELFGSVEQIVTAKGELVEALPPDGVAVLNREVAAVMRMVPRAACPVLTFGAGGDVRADHVVLDDELRASFTLRSPWGAAPVRLAVGGRHNVSNALAAAAAAMSAGAVLADVAEGLAAATLSPWRMELARTRRGAAVLNDAYNANPASVAAALHALAELPARRRVAVLGEMAELGIHGPILHREVRALAESLGIEVLAVGTSEYGVGPMSIDEVLDRLGPIEDGDAVLVKGSRVAGLERFAELLLEE